MSERVNERVSEMSERVSERVNERVNTIPFLNHNRQIQTCSYRTKYTCPHIVTYDMISFQIIEQVLI